jgi:hypothetical protein
MEKNEDKAGLSVRPPGHDPRLAGREIADAFARPRTGPSLNIPLIDKEIDYTGYA